MRFASSGAVLLLAMALSGCAGSRALGPVPLAVPGEPIQEWISQVRGEARFLMNVRNDTDGPIVLQTVKLSQCRNIRQVCGQSHPWAARIEPGEIASMTISPSDPGFQASFAFEVDYRVLPKE